MNAGSRNPRAIAVAVLDIPLELHAQEDEGSCYDDDPWYGWYDWDDDQLFGGPLEEFPKLIEPEEWSYYMDDEERDYTSFLL